MKTYSLSLVFVVVLAFLASSCLSPTLRPENQKQTLLYATHGGQKLYLDKLVDTTVAVTGKRPVIIWMFGGAWVTGQRDEKASSHMFDYLTAQGYVVIAIDYRLAIRDAKARQAADTKASTSVDAQTARSLYFLAINEAVEDLFAATRFTLAHAEEWNIDASQVVIGGGSAGAVNAVVAEYQVCTSSPLFRKYLPADFNYAGVISMAGALWLPGDNTPAAWTRKPCPFLFFHGSKDQVVTYNEAHGQGVAAYGPVSLYKQFAAAGYPVWFYDLPGADHVVSMAPMYDNLQEVSSFMEKFVRDKQPLTIHTVEESKTPKNFANLIKLYGKLLIE